MQTITTIGLDIAKSVFQVHRVDAQGQVAIRRQLKRRYVLAFLQKLTPCLVGIEACASRMTQGGLWLAVRKPYYAGQQKSWRSKNNFPRQQR